MWLLATVGAALVAGGMDASAAIIDSFDDVQGAVIDPTPYGLNFPYSYLASDVFLGSRELYVSLGAERSEISLTVEQGLALSTSNPDSAPDPMDPSVAHITWDGEESSADPTAVQPGGVGVNLLADGSNSFYVDTYVPQSSITWIALEVWDTVGTSFYKAWELPATTVPDLGRSYLSFDWFIDQGVDFGSVGAIRMHFLTDDVSIDSFGTIASSTPLVPLPGAAALGLFGMGLVVARRRRQNASA